MDLINTSSPKDFFGSVFNRGAEFFVAKEQSKIEAKSRALDIKQKALEQRAAGFEPDFDQRTNVSEGSAGGAASLLGSSSSLAILGIAVAGLVALKVAKVI